MKDYNFFPLSARIAVVAVMLITTTMLGLTMLVVWKNNILLIALFFIVFGFIEAVYFSSVLYKFVQGGYLPLAFSFFLMILMAIWHYVTKEKYMFELENKVSSEYVRELASKPEIKRMPGIGLLYAELVQGIPQICPHYLANIPSLHFILIFVSMKPFPFNKVALKERFLFRQVEPKEYRIFCCVVRLGYNDVIEGPEEFEQQLVQNLKEFIRHEHLISEAVATTEIGGVEEEMEFVEKQMEKGVVHLLGQEEVVAKMDSSLFKSAVVNYAYHFLRNNFRQIGKVNSIPHTRHLRVGMTYEI